MKDISAFQYIAFMNYLITDKTGCLTENHNKAMLLYHSQKQPIDVSDMENVKIEELKQNPTIFQIIRNISINSTAILTYSVLNQIKEEQGNKVDLALLKFAKYFLIDLE